MMSGCPGPVTKFGTSDRCASPRHSAAGAPSPGDSYYPVGSTRRREGMGTRDTRAVCGGRGVDRRRPGPHGCRGIRVAEEPAARMGRAGGPPGRDRPRRRLRHRSVRGARIHPPVPPGGSDADAGGRRGGRVVRRHPTGGPGPGHGRRRRSTDGRNPGGTVSGRRDRPRGHGAWCVAGRRDGGERGGRRLVHPNGRRTAPRNDLDRHTLVPHARSRPASSSRVPSPRCTSSTPRP